MKNQDILWAINLALIGRTHSDPDTERLRNMREEITARINHAESFKAPAEIYQAYPLKVGKPAAIRAIQNAMKGHSPEFLLKRTKLYAQTVAGTDVLIPHPSTFYNQERFNDDPETWAPYQSIVAPAARSIFQIKSDIDTLTNRRKKLSENSANKIAGPVVGQLIYRPEIREELDDLNAKIQTLEMELRK